MRIQYFKIFAPQTRRVGSSRRAVALLRMTEKRKGLGNDPQPKLANHVKSLSGNSSANFCWAVVAHEWCVAIMGGATSVHDTAVGAAVVKALMLLLCYCEHGSKI